MYEKQMWLIDQKIKQANLNTTLFKWFIAGGALTSVFSSKSISDLDIFFNSFEDYKLMRNSFDVDINQDNVYIKVPVIETNNAVSYCINDCRVQLIKKLFGTPEEVINQFDFTVCMGAYIPQERKIILDESFLYHLSQRILCFNTNAKYPIASLWRAKKYIKKDFVFPAIEAIKLSLTINNLNIKTYKDLKEQLEGIDTLFLKDLTDALLKNADKEFNFREAIQYMDEILSKTLHLEE